MSEPAKNTGCLKTAFYVVLAGFSLWLGLHILLTLTTVLSTLSLALFQGLDASYGRLGGLLGYVLLGLGLGAAAGAIAAQQRFRLHKLILAAAAAVGLLLVGLAFAGPTQQRSSPADFGYAPSSAEPETRPSLPSRPIPAPTKTPLADVAPIAEDTATVVAIAEADTASQPAQGLRRVVTGHAPLRASWLDSLGQPTTQLRQADTVRLLRRAHHWALVARAGTDSAAAPTGWMRLAALRPLRPAAGAAGRPLTRPPAVSQWVAQEPAAPAPAPAVPTHPTGHHQYTGHVGQLETKYSIDWQDDGTLSGSYFYLRKPGIIYRLTGAVAVNGDLDILEFTRGQQSARCVLQRQDAGYAGTMTNASGQQLAMSLE